MAPLVNDIKVQVAEKLSSQSSPLTGINSTKEAEKSSKTESEVTPPAYTSVYSDLVKVQVIDEIKGEMKEVIDQLQDNYDLLSERLTAVERQILV